MQIGRGRGSGAPRGSVEGGSCGGAHGDSEADGEQADVSAVTQPGSTPIPASTLSSLSRFRPGGRFVNGRKCGWERDGGPG
jgi:hypothetical protein